MDPETQRLINLLKVALRILGVTNREVARRMGISPSYISKLFSGTSEMRLEHVIRVLRAIDLEPVEFFSLAYPRHPATSSPAATQLRDLLQTIQVAPPPKPAATLDEEQVQALKSTLEKILGRTA
jgi:transcriptional regulator with XRE-family HTH domain